MRFRFRLDPVLDQRARIEDEKKRVLAEAERDLRTAEAVRDDLCARREALAAELSSIHRVLDVETLRASYAHLDFLARSITESEQRIDACALDVMRARGALVIAAKDRKVLDTLKTRRRETFEAEVALIEQRELDDANARRYGRIKLSKGLAL